jgi:hypothetical protein
VNPPAHSVFAFRKWLIIFSPSAITQKLFGGLSLIAWVFLSINLFAIWEALWIGCSISLLQIARVLFLKKDSRGVERQKLGYLFFFWWNVWKEMNRRIFNSELPVVGLANLLMQDIQIFSEAVSG